jgi:hypothetical protein
VSKVTAATAAHAVPGAPPRPLAAPLRRVRRIGYVVLGLQLAGFLVWSTILYHRFALTWDFAVYHQAWFLIAHGNIDPYNSVQGFPFWRTHCEFLLWPLAPLYWIWPHDVLLLWLQDAGVVAAEAVAFTWLCELAQKYRPGRDAAWLAGAGLVLLAVNPWIFASVSWDYHTEPLAILFAALVARDLANGRRRAWACVAPLLGCGDVAGTYLAALGLGGVLAGRRSRLPGSVMACLGVGATLVITLIHGNLGSGRGLQAYAYLAAAGPLGAPLSLAALAKGIATHPLGVLRVLWAKRLDLWANLAPSGLAGIGFVWLLPITVVVLLANNLWGGWLFAPPGFQSLPLYVLLPAGTVAVLGRLMRRHRRAALLLTGLLVAQALAWAAVWGPRLPGQWLRVPAPAAATLASIEARIPASAEVIASQGVAGRFSGHAHVRPLFGPGTLPVNGQTWFIITPMAGIETLSTASAMALTGELAGPLRATLVTHTDGVWAFRWRPPPGVHTVTVPGDPARLAAWAAPMAPGGVGRPVMTGPVADWRMTSSAGKGYVADEIAWQQPPGRYQASVTLSATGPVNVEVWNDTGNVLLARRNIPATTGVESVVLPVDAAAAYRSPRYSGWGPFRADFVPPPPGERLEVRVWSPGTGTVNVYGAGLIGAGRNSPGAMAGP